jgi:serine O-acetyltransferase
MSAVAAESGAAGGQTLTAAIFEDLETYEFDVTEPGLWVTAVHRVRAWSERTAPRALLPALRGVTSMLASTADWLFGIRVPPDVTLGRRVRIWHHGCMHLCARSIGDDVHIRPNTTFGALRGAPDVPEGWPVIGDGADIGAGVAILGAVRVGTQAFVGANSLVLADVPDGTVALGVPARHLPGRR